MTESNMEISSEKLTKKQKKTLKFKNDKKNKNSAKDTNESSVSSKDVDTEVGFEDDTEKTGESKKRKSQEKSAPVKKGKGDKGDFTINRSNPQKTETSKNKKKASLEESSGESVQVGASKNKNTALKNSRYIVFVGNLPFNCTVEELTDHLKSCGGEISARLITDKNTNKPKGIAFVEFENSISLSKALHLHHSTFKGRKINVEITAGGGGSSDARKKKLSERNEKLTKERAQFAEKKKDPKNKKASVSDDFSSTVDSGMNPERARLLSKNPPRSK